ncbi:hypothetical protein [Fusibacter tunisiensis]|jgi:hypothetical protein|uniref:Lipoprotein n=1 Tax=Fusibacter tunisiensis TaxID=1008308 RepID=A0ABS2MMS4_9FIRM|nr:hypothetical protein [Fusibacter tunisiensis]MBM7560691.1 hypothetical protein [Fusibacter tunisiensis]
MNKRRFFMIVLMLFVVLALTACVPGDGKNTSEDPAGFFWGIWHGWLAPLSLIIGIFNKNIRVYEVFNTGWAYDVGFYMAVISGFGGLSVARKKKKD